MTTLLRRPSSASLISVNDCSRIAFTHFTKAGFNSGPDDAGFDLSAAIVDTGTCVTASIQDASCLKSLEGLEHPHQKMFFIKPDSHGIEMLDPFTFERKVWFADTFASLSSTAIPVGCSGFAGTLSVSQSTLGVPPTSSSKSPVSSASSCPAQPATTKTPERRRNVTIITITICREIKIRWRSHIVMCVCGDSTYLPLWHSAPHQHWHPQEYGALRLWFSPAQVGWAADDPPPSCCSAACRLASSLEIAWRSRNKSLVDLCSIAQAPLGAPQKFSKDTCTDTWDLWDLTTIMRNWSHEQGTCSHFSWASLVLRTTHTFVCFT